MATSWELCNLGDVLTLQRDFDLPNRERQDGAVPIVSSSGITGFHNQAKVKAPGVVTGRYGTLGEVFYVDQDFWPLNTTLFVKDFKGNDPLFVSYFLKTLNLAHQNAAGAVPGLNRNALHLLPVRKPTLLVQRRIADILSAYDRLIENNTRRIKILEEMARSLYDEWFVKFRFPGHEQTKLINSELGLIPEDWEVKTFGDVSINFDRKRIPLSSIQRSKRQGEYRYYGASGVIDYIDDYIFDGKYLLIAEDGENLNSRKLPIAFLASGKFWVNNHAHIVQGKSPVSSELLCLFMKALDILGYITGAAQPKLSQSNLNRIPFILPSEQLLNRFNEVACQLLNQIENFHRKNQNLQKTRDLLLPKLISGEIDVEKLNGMEEEGAISSGEERTSNNDEVIISKGVVTV